MYSAAKPSEPYPTILTNGCEAETLKVCYLKLETPHELGCRVEIVGEVIDELSWMLRTIDGDENIPSHSFNATTSENGLQSFRVDLNVPLDTFPALSLYVCSSKSKVSEVGSNETAILVDHGSTKTKKELSPIVLRTPPYTTVTLECGGTDVLSLLWRRDDGNEDIIAFSVLNNARERIHKVNLDGFDLGDDNSLVIKSVTEQTVDMYTCVYSKDGIATSYVSYEVTTEGENQVI